MIVDEVEYRKAFKYHRTWAKHWLTNSAHRAHSSTSFMSEPAAKTLKFIDELILNKNNSYKEKFELLDKFYNEEDHIVRSSKSMGNSYYFDSLQYNKRVFINIAKGEPVMIYKMPRG
jgi:hypothetical protein